MADKVKVWYDSEVIFWKSPLLSGLVICAKRRVAGRPSEVLLFDKI